jgi:hypothetical protein
MSKQTIANRLWERVPQREKVAHEWKKGSAMFGDPAWFRAKTIGWGLVPTRWQGWAYTGLWAVAITVPFVMMLSRHLVPEALVWVGASIGALVWDVRNILRAMHAPAPVAVAVEKTDVLYIGDDQADPTRLATRNFDLQVRK